MFKNPFAALKKMIGSTEEATPTGKIPGTEAAPDAAVEALRAALGGAANIVKAQPAAETRLLVTLRDNGLVRPDAIRGIGLNVFVPKKGRDIHVLAGLHPERFGGI